MKICFVTYLGGSIAEISRDIISHLRECGHEVISSFDQDDVHTLECDLLICHHWVRQLDLSEKRCRKAVLILPVDETSISMNVVEPIRQHFDLVITPSVRGWRILADNGLSEVPAIVVPNYFKPEMLAESDLAVPFLDDDEFVFYNEAVVIPRKAHIYLMGMFLRAFNEFRVDRPITLLIKGLDMSDLSFSIMEDVKRTLTSQMEAAGKKIRQKLQIKFLSQYLSWERLSAIWNRVDAYYHIPHIEGFGIPLLRMAAMQKPIVTLSNINSGYMDFLNEDNSYMIESRHKTVAGSHQPSSIVGHHTRWAMPIAESAVDALRACYAGEEAGVGLRVDPADLRFYEHRHVMSSYESIFRQLLDGSLFEEDLT